jgi:hypothetical protein
VIKKRHPKAAKMFIVGAGAGAVIWIYGSVETELKEIFTASLKFKAAAAQCILAERLKYAVP